MGLIINPFMVAAAGGGGASTDYIRVRLAQFDVSDCSCTLSESYVIIDDGNLGASLTPAVSGWISVTTGMETFCAQVQSINQADTDPGTITYTVAAYADCDACNAAEEVCSEGGGPPGP